MKEIDYNKEFKTIPGFYNYVINGYGVVRSIGRNAFSNKIIKRIYGRKSKIINQFKSYGYNKVSLINRFGETKKPYVHRLVALTFKLNPNPDKFNIVNHLDGNILNNYWKNLQWCNYSINNKHAYDSLGRIGKRGSLSHLAKLNENQVYEIKNILKLKSRTQKEIAKEYGVKRQTINDINTGKIWGHLKI